MFSLKNKDLRDVILHFLSHRKELRKTLRDALSDAEDRVSLLHLNRHRHQTCLQHGGLPKRLKYFIKKSCRFAVGYPSWVISGSDRVQCTARLLAQFSARAQHSHGFNPSSPTTCRELTDLSQVAQPMKQKHCLYSWNIVSAKKTQNCLKSRNWVCEF